MAYIEFRNINKFYGENQVLSNIRLDINKGDLVTLLGPSGCGKSTLLRCLAGLETVSSGQIMLDHVDITGLPPKQRNIGMVFQQYSLFPNMTVFQNVAFGLQVQKVPKETIRKKVTEMLDVVGLSDRASHYPSQLSGGQQQRVALARALVTEPKVLLLDEPLSAIDAMLRKSLQTEIRRIQKEWDITTIFVTHDQDEAMVMSDRIHLFNVGCVEQSGTPVEMYTSPKTEFAASFIGHYNILTQEQFQKVTGELIPQGQQVAIRPETMEPNTEGNQPDNFYSFEGTIVESVSHGNVLRYTVEVNGVQLEMDVLFRSFRLFDAGSKVHISLEKRNCLFVGKTVEKNQLDAIIRVA